MLGCATRLEAAEASAARVGLASAAMQAQCATIAQLKADVSGIRLAQVRRDIDALLEHIDRTGRSPASKAEPKSIKILSHRPDDL